MGWRGSPCGAKLIVKENNSESRPPVLLHGISPHPPRRGGSPDPPAGFGTGFIPRGGFRPLGEFLSQRWERNQRIAGGDSHRRREQVPSGSSSFSPRPPENTRPNSRGLPNTVRRGRDNDCPRIHAAAAVGPKLRRAAALDQTGAPDCSRSNLCGGKSAGGSGDPPLRHFRQIIAERDNGRGEPRPYGTVGGHSSAENRRAATWGHPYGVSLRPAR